MYTTEFEYVRAATLDEAISLLKEDKDAKLLAGGHSLLPAMKFRLARPGKLIDIGRIEDLRGIDKSKDTVSIGALTTHAMIAASDDVPTALSEAAAGVGDPQVRVRGTIGGNIAHADPGSDLPIVLVALGATVQLMGSGGKRSVAAEDFFMGLFETALSEGEVITSIEIPVSGKGSGSAYAKLANPASRYAMVGAAATLTVNNGTCDDCSVAVGGLTHMAIKAPSVAAALVGKEISDESIVEAAQAVQSDLGGDILSDIHANEEYRRAMATVIVKNALTDAAARA
ncbi:MAG: xanthine dehydrogenase family protein subunit M [Verrucomicrobia bacterium]|nr:xanthine dehydrogenase family protein subunit M [Verrucomicrobiota bacterium]